MLLQAKLQITISSETLKETPDLGLISHESQKFNKSRSRVLRKLKHIFHVIPDCFIEPLILAAGYFLSLNHSITDFEQFSKLYLQKFHKYEKFFAQDQIANENLYQDNVGSFVLSGHGEDAGKIVYTNSRSTKFFGGTPESLAGTHISGRAPPCLRGFYSAYYKLLTQRDANLQNFFLDTIIEGFNYHHDGYMILTNYYMNIHPVLTHGLYLLALQRSVPNSKDYMYMLENGDIDCVTKEFGTKLGLIPCYKDSSNKPLFNVSKISSELEIANEAFNMIALPEKFPPKNLTLEEAQEIYEMYTTTGCDLDFNVYDEKNGSYLIFSYHCKIKGSDSGIPTLKLLTLQENKMDSQVGSKENSIASPLEELEKSKSHNFEIESEEMEEKKQGWIDFEPLTSRINTPLTTQRGLLSSSPRETAVSIIQNNQNQEEEENGSPLNSRVLKRKMTKKLLNVVRVLNLEKKIKRQEKSQEEDPEDGDFQSRVSVNTSYISKGSRQRKVCKLYQDALDLFYVPKTFYILLIFFYIALIIVLVCRSVIKVILDDMIADMKIKKDILTNAQFRNYTLISIQSIIRSFWDVNTGAVDFSSLGVVAVLIGAFEQFVTSSLTILATTNQDLLQNATFLEKGTQDFLFQKDVKIFDTYFDAPVQIFSSLNTFQATDRVIEKGLDLVHFGGAITPESIDNSNFIFRNTLNDLVVKNEGTSDLIRESLVPQRKSFQAIIREYLIAVILFIIFITVTFAIVSWKQYKKEKYYLTASCRLNPERTTKVLEKFKHFVETIQSQVPLNLNSFEISSTISPMKPAKDDHKKEFSTKSPKTQGIKRFYIIAIIKMIILMIVIIGANIFISIFNLAFLSRFRVKQDQLYFANRIEARVSLTVTTYRELLRTNNLARVENKPALTELTKLIEELSTLKNEAFDELLVGGSQENSDISNVLIGDPCSILGSSLYTYLCEDLKTQGKKTGMIYSTP